MIWRSEKQQAEAQKRSCIQLHSMPSRAGSLSSLQSEKSCLSNPRCPRHDVQESASQNAVFDPRHPLGHPSGSNDMKLRRFLAFLESFVPVESLGYGLGTPNPIPSSSWDFRRHRCMGPARALILAPSSMMEPGQATLVLGTLPWPPGSTSPHGCSWSTSGCPGKATAHWRTTER